MALVGSLWGCSVPWEISTISPMRRYVVTTTPDQRRWGILDLHWYGYCTLPDGNGNFLPLEWNTRQGAEAWLYKCRVAWGKDLVPAPADWQAFKPEPSPWDAAYYNR